MLASSSCKPARIAVMSRSNVWATFVGILIGILAAFFRYSSIFALIGPVIVWSAQSANFSSDRGANVYRIFVIKSAFNALSSSFVGFKTLPAFKYSINASKCCEIDCSIGPAAGPDCEPAIPGNGGCNACDLNVSFNCCK